MLEWPVCVLESIKGLNCACCFMRSSAMMPESAAVSSVAWHVEEGRSILTSPFSLLHAFILQRF